MPLQVLCPVCGKGGTVSEDSLGRLARCSRCKGTFRLTAPARPDGAGVAPTLLTTPPATPHLSLPEGAGVRPPPARPGALPDRIGRFRVRARLGSGAFGTV